MKIELKWVFVDEIQVNYFYKACMKLLSAKVEALEEEVAELKLAILGSALEIAKRDKVIGKV